MKKRLWLIVCLVATVRCSIAQSDSIVSFAFRNDVLVSIDFPRNFSSTKNTQLIFFALPNGNSTAQTMGKKMQAGDDWHYDIQHIAAQTKFVRDELNNENIVVVYLENAVKSWPAWKRNHPEFKLAIPKLLDTVVQILALKKYAIQLCSHSGGGSFIFGYLDAVKKIPKSIKRISFIDSDYGYDSSYTNKLINWVNVNKNHQLTVFAYNDSVALYNGKPIVSATGGTWYKSKLMMKDLSNSFAFTQILQDSISHFTACNKQINIFLVDNPERKILHTQQVELNGFIHSILIATSKENIGYQYFKQRAYNQYIQ